MTKSETVNLADIREQLKSKPGLANVGLDLLYLRFESDPYLTFISLINRSLDYALDTLAKNPELKKKSSEDMITIEIVNILKTAGFNADHDTKIGGHCDIVIEEHYHTFCWLGEAKKIDSVNNSYLNKGFKQLTTRYANGNQNHTYGGLLIYSYAPNLKHVMQKWKEHMQAEYQSIEISQCEVRNLAFHSVSTNQSTGLDYNVRHIPVSFYFSPQDK
ncbi:MAG: hypothetical protein CMP22_05770 [Rickettsiales bacterium]|nr:hypothetical protein [Rickettsiales bacterium]|tara:strand:+ start:415 stop:1065 length:651 start_codon:yes stop_codon:yes gene_type:complete